MSLDNYDIWGCSKDEVVKFGKFYSVYYKIMYILDIIATIIAIYYMNKSDVTFGTYVKIMLTISVICIFALNIPLNEELWGIYKFIRRYRRKEVLSMSVNVSSDDLYSCLYNCYRSRLRKGESLEYYFQFANNICKKNSNFSRKFMKQLSQFYCNDSNGNFTVYYLQDGKKLHYLNNKVIDKEVS